MGDRSVSKDGHSEDRRGKKEHVGERCMGEEGEARDTEGHAGKGV